MNNENPQVDSLKAAMLERARLLAEEHVTQGRTSRQKILQDAREKIHLMEQKELLLAKAESERAYQRQLQASEIQLQSELDRNRWGLVQAVMHRLQEQLQQLPDDEQNYSNTFKNLLEQAVNLIHSDSLVAHVNARDLRQLAGNWSSLIESLTDKQVRLADQPFNCSGGVLVLSSGGDMRVDNTFEGMIERQRRELEQTIFERLFATVDGTGALLHG